MEYLYIIQEGSSNIYKIGRSYNVKTRRNTCQTGNSNKLKIIKKFECLNCKILEKRVHHHLYDKHVSGEWFKLSNDNLCIVIDMILKFIIEINKKVNTNTCVICNFKTYKNENFQRHLESKTHILKSKSGTINHEETTIITKDNITKQNTLNNKFTCDSCKYTTDIKFCYDKHLTTVKHSLNVSYIAEQMKLQHANNNKRIYNCNFCGNEYASPSTLSRHKKSCGEKVLMDETYKTEIEKYKHEITYLKEMNDKMYCHEEELKRLARLIKSME